MYIDRPVKYNPASGHITVVVDSGYVTQGSFKLSMTDGTTTKLVGTGDFGDNVPDVFLLPVPPAQLANWALIIIGSYAPAAGHTQIKLDYIFRQQGTEVDREEVKANGTHLLTEHNFTF